MQNELQQFVDKPWDCAVHCATLSNPEGCEVPQLSVYDVTLGLFGATTTTSEGSRIFRMVQGWRMRGIQSVIDLLVIARPRGLWASMRYPVLVDR